MNLLLRACLLACLSFPSISCRKAPAPPPAPTVAPPLTASWPATRKTERGNFTVTIQPRGGKIVRGEHFTLEVQVEPVTGVGTPVSVVADADMPSHGHGMNTKAETVHETGSRYRADGMLFHMGGEWSISVAVSAGKGEERALFPVTIE